MSGAKLRKGDKIAARVHHNGLKSGTQGKVVSVHNGPYYGVNYPGVQGVCYTPDPLATPVSGAAAGPPGPPGISSPALSAATEHVQRVGIWERLMSMVGTAPS